MQDDLAGRLHSTGLRRASPAEAGNPGRLHSVAHDVSNIARLLDDATTTIAVVGATEREHKYGSIIYRDLRSKGFTVFAVNPYRDTVHGDPCWHTVSDLPEAPTIVNFVVPPARTLEVLDECRGLGYTTVWVQPGAEDESVVAYLEEHGFDHLVRSCIMVRARSLA